MGKLDSKIALITGSNSGIGLATANKVDIVFANAGAAKWAKYAAVF